LRKLFRAWSLRLALLDWITIFGFAIYGRVALIKESVEKLLEPPNAWTFERLTCGTFVMGIV
jgi:hypothetical protein